MKRNPKYDGAKYIESNEVCYGSKVTAYFYVGDKIKEGEPFGCNEDTAYVDDMGSDWEKGHMLAKSLGGDNKVHNLLPMKKDVNNSTFKKVENFVHTLFDNLSDIQDLCKEGVLHIKYTVERVKGTIITVKGYKFPGQFMYTIEVQNSKDETVDEDKLRTVLEYLGITNEVELSDIIHVR